LRLSDCDRQIGISAGVVQLRKSIAIQVFVFIH
jgi:hypothetical protein